MSHHYSGPDWGFPHGDARLDLTDLYAFPKEWHHLPAYGWTAAGRVPAVAACSRLERSMTWKNSAQFLASSLLLTIALASGPARAKDPVKEVRLYAIECGRMEVKDMGAFADTGEYDGQSGTLAVSCYLIRHPKGTLLWDAGLSDKLAENKAGVDAGGFKLTVVRPLVDQLKSIELTPADVT